MENNQEIIRLENVSKSFDLRYHKTLRAVDNVSLSCIKASAQPLWVNQAAVKVRWPGW